ncbi:MAG: hypothetical protein ACE149_07050 [Armatimonadota bacterium]
MPHAISRRQQSENEECEIRSILNKARDLAGKQLGRPMPRAVWEYIVSTFGGDLTGREEAEGFADFVPQYVGLLQAFCDSTDVRSGKRKTRQAVDQSPTSKALARKLELIWFVTERVVPFLSFREGSLRTNFKRGPGARGRAKPWEKLREEWNCTHTHPSEHMSSGETLRREYREAVTNRHVVSALLEELKPRQVEAVLQRTCLMSPGASPASLGRICLREFPSVQASPPSDIREVLKRADFRPKEIHRLLGITEEEMREHANAVRAYMREKATREDRLARVTVDPKLAAKPLLAMDDEEPRLSLCGACLRPYVLGE